MSSPITFRYEINASDPQHIRDITESTGVFSPVEIDIAVELAEERLAKGPASGYHFIFAERDGKVLGYTCYGPIALTVGSYDLFWIAVDKSTQGLGLGRTLLEKSEQIVRREGGRRIYIETSTRPPYAPTRAFYQRSGYRLEVVLEEFYGPGDGKAIYVKAVDAA
jgi:GNAT superfamily N-acetyltransferase